MSAKTRHGRSRRGAILALVAVMLPVFLIMSAMALNVAYMNLTRTELRIATDAASRAAGRTLTISGDKDQVRLFARDAAGRNAVGNDPLLLADSDFEFGRSQRTATATKYDFVPDNATLNPNAVRITGRRTTGSPSGPIPLFMPNVVGLGTYEPQHGAIATQLEMDIVLVVDRSGSMAYADDQIAGQVFPPPNAPPGWDWGQAVPPGSRWIDSFNAVNAFLNEMASTPIQEHVALATYSDTATLDVQLTSDYMSILDGLAPHSATFNGGSTNIGGGMYKALDAFSNGLGRPWATKVLIVLTDGIHYTGTSPYSAAYTCRRNSVVVYTVTFSDEAEQSTMQRVADKTGGLHHHATTGAALIQAFRDIANSLPTLLTR